MKLFKPPKDGPKVLLFDLETAYAIAKIWRLGKQYVGEDQLVEEPSLIAFAAKWLGSPENEVMYFDVRNQRNYRDDKRLCRYLVKLFDQADVVLTQNGKNFDEPLFKWRLAVNDLPNPSPCQHMDTKRMADQLGCPSSRLAYLTKKLNKKYKKLDHEAFSGRKMWDECLDNRNMKAWAEMERYNRHDVLATEELYTILAPRTKSGVNLNVYRDRADGCPSCGSGRLNSKGYFYTNAGKYARWKCLECGHSFRSGENLLSKEKRASLKRPA